MKKLMMAVVMLALAMVVASPGWGAVPMKLSVQGKFSGTPTPMTARFVVNGTGGSSVTTTISPFTLEQGVFNVSIDVTDAVLANGDATVDIYIPENTKIANQPLLSVPYALRAAEADHAAVADSLADPTKVSPFDYIAGGNGIYYKATAPFEGRVGIGTDVPEAKLNVNPNGPGGIVISDPSRLYRSSFKIALSDSNDGSGYGILQAKKAQSNNGTIAINPDGGNVGIGTTMPGKQLDVTGDINFTGTLYQNNVPVPLSGAALWVKVGSSISPNPMTSKISIGNSVAADYLSILPANEAGGIQIGGAGPSGFTALKLRTSSFTGGYSLIQSIQSNYTAPTAPTYGILALNPSGGNVGVGTATPGQKLSVAGLIESTTGGFKFPDGTTLNSSYNLNIWTQGPSGFTSSTNQSIGIGTDNPTSKFVVSTSSATNAVTAIAGNGIGVYGYSVTNAGVYGVNNQGTGPGIGGVVGRAGSNPGVYGHSITGDGLYGDSYSGNALHTVGKVKFSSITLANSSSLSAPLYNLYIDSQGNVCESINSVGSSLRYKENVSDLVIDKDKVLDLRPVSFTWKKEGNKDIGLIAEEVDRQIKDLTVYNSAGLPEGVKYDKLPVYLLGVIKEQEKTINAQQKKIDDLTTRLEKLEAKIK